MKTKRMKTPLLLGPPPWMIEQELRDIVKRMEILRRIQNGERIKFNVEIKPLAGDAV